MPNASLGFDFGTESVRVVVVDIHNGHVLGQATSRYAHGVISQTLPGLSERLPDDFALQHPRDWLDSLSIACKSAMSASHIDAGEVVGIGIDFTSCTMLPCKQNGTPLCLLDEFKADPMAWPKLWKHHGAKPQTQRINQIAKERNESWLTRYGGSIGLEWFFPKMLETLDISPGVYQAADLFIEAGDWLVWQLTTGPFPKCDAMRLVRSTCQAGYKAMWNAKHGYPSRDFFSAVHPQLANVIESKMPGSLKSPGERAGLLSEAATEQLGLSTGIPISTATIDAHSGVPGAGVADAGTLVMVLGTSSCHMLNSHAEQLAPGIAGVVENGILPGFFGYETGQTAVGDAFAWLVETFGLSHEMLSREAAMLPPGSGGVMAVDWFNGCRTPLMDASVTGALIGLTLSTRPAQIYRAIIEATAFGVRWIIDTLREAGVPVQRFVASGGLPAKSPLLMQIYADVLGETISLAESDQSVALGAAILGCLAAGTEATGYATIGEAIHAMARQRSDLVYRPNSERREPYDTLYALYRSLCDCNGSIVTVMRQLRSIGQS